MTFFEAALRVLQEADGGPLGYKEIAKRAVSSGYIKTKGRTPEASLGAQLYTHIKKAMAAGQEPKVRRVGRGQFALSARATTGPLRSVEDYSAKVRSQLREQLMKLHPRALENLVGALLSTIGFENVSVLSYSGDGGLDVEAELTVGGVANVKTAVQVKRWKNSVSGRVVRELRGGLMTDQRGLIITTSSFTKDAIREAGAESKTPTSLVDGEKLLDLLIENEIGVSKKTLSYLELDLESLGEFEEESDASTGQALGIWPLPGGKSNYVKSALKMLKFVAQNEPNQDQMISWMRKAFLKAKSRKSIVSYIGVLRTLRLTTYDGETIGLTEAGSDALAKAPRDVMLNQIRVRVAGVAEYLEALQKKPMTFSQSHEFFKKQLSVDWETDYQTRFRLIWLENVSAIRKAGQDYVLA